MKFTEEHKRRISKALMGHRVSEKVMNGKQLFKKGMTPWNKGI